MIKRIIILTALAAIGMLTLAGVTMAATLFGSTNATTSVAANCISGSPVNIDFGNYNPLATAANISGAGSVSLQCIKNTQYKAYITGTRTLVSGSNNLPFTLWQDTARTGTPWPSTAPSTATTSSSKTAVVQNIYGKIAAGYDVSISANYTANVTFTVDY